MGASAFVKRTFADSIFLLTLRMMPKNRQLNSTEVPPQLTIGSVNPLTGVRCVAMAIFAKAEITMFKLKPTATIAPNDFSLMVTSLVVRKNSRT